MSAAMLVGTQNQAAALMTVPESLLLAILYMFLAMLAILYVCSDARRCLIRVCSKWRYLLHVCRDARSFGIMQRLRCSELRSICFIHA